MQITTDRTHGREIVVVVTNFREDEAEEIGDLIERLTGERPWEKAGGGR